jgi:[ribosomal protein S18]-alanine N-acetyltransferase
VTEPESKPLLRPMEISDLASAIEVDTLCLPRPWSEAIWREELESPWGLYLVMDEDGWISAQIGVRYLADELHVTTLAVRPERRRRGYARALLEAALGAFPEARRVHLEVRPTNEPAISLYQRRGFVTTGRRRRYYGDEDALLMTLDLEDRR